jgi:Ca2+-binding EF-hand superfamily protein
MTGWWVALEAASDQDRDDKVRLDEVLIVVDQLGAMRSEILVTANSMFGTIDEDGDGMISSGEYK